MKDHEKRELINELTRVAFKYAGMDQLRQQISNTVMARLETIGNMNITDNDNYITDEYIDRIYTEVSDQTLRPQDKPLVNKFARAIWTDALIWYNEQMKKELK